MPRFRRNESNLELPPEGIYLAQVSKASNKTSSNGNPMIQLILKTIPDRYTFFYHLVFTSECEGLTTHFCHACEGELILPADEQDEFDLTIHDCLNRLVFIDTKHEPIVKDDPESDKRASVKAILKRIKALAKAPHLADLFSPPNVPPPKALPIVSQAHSRAAAAIALTNGRDPNLDAEPDDIPF